MAHLPKYKLFASENLALFRFVSTGPKGNILKTVHYFPLYADVPTVNLGFGNDDGFGNINEKRTNNGDIFKIIATVAATIYVFTDRYPETEVYFTGADPQLTKLYNSAIDRYYEQLIQDFHIFGVNGEVTDDGNLRVRSRVRYAKGTSYPGFIVVRRKEAQGKGIK